MSTIAFRQKNLIFNSSVLFIIAAILEMTFHELGHFVAALVAGATDVILYHNYVTYNIDGLSPGSILFIAAAGPNVSLLIGLIFHYICSVQTNRNLFSLFCLYMAVFGYIGCFGYIMISPFFSYGDTGYICYVLDFPVWLTFLVAILGVVILFMLMKSLTRYFVELGTKEIIEQEESRVEFIHTIMLYPLFIGIIVTALLNLPSPTFLSLLAPICSPFTIMWTYGYARRKNYSNPHYNTNIGSVDKVDILWIVVLLLIVNLNRLLTNGFFIPAEKPLTTEVSEEKER